MRVHDVNVVADLNGHDPDSSTLPPTQDPPAGEEQAVQDYDGTQNGGTSTGYHMQAADTSLSDGMNDLQLYWTGWWPLLHVVYSIPISGDGVQLTLSFHIAKNLLGISEYTALQISGDESFYTDAVPVLLALAFENIFALVMINAVLVASNILEAVVNSASYIPGALIGAISLVVATVTVSYLAPVHFIQGEIEAGRASNIVAFGFLLEVAWAWLNLGMDMKGIYQTGGLFLHSKLMISNYLPACRLKDFLKITKLAYVLVLSIGVALLATAIWYLLNSF